MKNPRLVSLTDEETQQIAELILRIANVQGENRAQAKSKLELSKKRSMLRPAPFRGPTQAEFDNV